MTPIVELGLAEAFAILTEQLGVSRESFSPLDAIENEDWGRDLLLGKLQAMTCRAALHERARARTAHLLEPPGAYRRKARRETRKQRPDWA